MCVPEIFIRDDGKGFVVRKGGIDLRISTKAHYGHACEGETFIAGADSNWDNWGYGDTIMEAVDNALAKVRAAEKSIQVDKAAE